MRRCRLPRMYRIFRMSRRRRSLLDALTTHVNASYMATTKSTTKTCRLSRMYRIFRMSRRRRSLFSYVFIQNQLPRLILGTTSSGSWIRWLTRIGYVRSGRVLWRDVQDVAFLRVMTVLESTPGSILDRPEGHCAPPATMSTFLAEGSSCSL